MEPRSSYCGTSTEPGPDCPRRFVMGVGSGFTGRLTLGQRPNRWSFVA
jgi:hypothetical protein